MNLQTKSKLNNCDFRQCEKLITVYLEEILAYLPDVNSQDFVLDIAYSVANQTPIALDSYLHLFDARVYYDSFKIEKIISTVGKSIKVDQGNILVALVVVVGLFMIRNVKFSSIRKQFSNVFQSFLSHVPNVEILCFESLHLNITRVNILF